MCKGAASSGEGVHSYTKNTVEQRMFHEVFCAVQWCFVCHQHIFSPAICFKGAV